MNKKIIFIIISVISSHLFSYPESHLHSTLNFKGVKLPEVLKNKNTSPQFALYNGKGVWDTGFEHLKLFLTAHHFTYQTITSNEIKQGVLALNQFKVLIMPGGESWEYLAELQDSGADKIKEFVSNGGSYIGICAGAFYATKLREGGHTTGPYGIGLLNGTAYDGTALETPPFIEGMMDFNIMANSLFSDFAKVFRIVLFGGPSFRYSNETASSAKISVLASYQKINEPAMILFQQGKGKIFLSGPHLEIEENRTDWGNEYLDPDSEWPLLEKVSQNLLSSTR